ncbi:hypothetical protein K438DRAFT_1754098 [Mycena galopus ATCC 62051]|nr:hypothetical protein K438DRAFT_1754098 [Mycena galopus ATCC 62051]
MASSGEPAAAEDPPLDPPANSDLSLPTSGDAAWTELDEKAFIEYLIEHLPEAGDGPNFKKPTLEGAAKAVNLIRTSGGPKTFASCGAKLKQLRKFQGFVEKIMTISGWNWDPKKGVNVTPETRSSWDDWVKKNKGSGRFRNKGWPHYDRLLLLMPSKAKGGNVFRAGTASTQMELKASSPEWDYDAMERDLGREDEDSRDGDGDGDEDEGNGPSVLVPCTINSS